jgi:N-acetylneuraminic acid mutarotase
MKRSLFLCLFFSLSTPAFAATYYIATNGSDSSPGTASQPWATFDHAWTGMSPGDTLLIQDGTYFQHLRLPTSLSGTAAGYTTIAAVHPWMVTVDGSTSTPSGEATLYLESVSYVEVRGIKFASSPSSGTMLGPLSVYYSNHIKILQTAAYNAPCAGNVAVFDIGPGSSYILVEDSHASGCGRYKFLAYQSDHIIFRHDVSRHDYHDVTGWPGAITGWGRQCATYTMYDSTNVLIQNAISIDSGMSDQSNGILWGGIWSENNGVVDNSGKYEGDIFLNVQSGQNYVSTINDPKLIGTREAVNVAIVNSKSGYVGDREDGTGTPASLLLHHLTFANITGTNPDGGNAGDGVGAVDGSNGNFTQEIIKDSIIQQAHAFGVADFMNSDYNLFYQNNANFGSISSGGVTPAAGAHDRLNVNPQLKYPVRVEAGTPGKGTASDGGDVGATILFRMGTPGALWGESGYDTLTSIPLWPWTDEGVIKSDMASFSMANPIAGGTISGARGFAAGGTGLYGGPITLTSYIWESLGNACPADVCSGSRTLSSIAVSPGTASTLVGGTSQFTATCTYSDGSTADCSASATWSSSSPAVATISGGGLASGVGAGTTTIKAASGSVSGTATLTVTSAVLTAIAVTPATASIAAGSGALQYTARCSYSNGTSSDCTATVTWSSSNPAAATISGAGLASGVGAGTTTIKAASGSVSGTATLTVTGTVLTAIAVTPATASIAAGSGSQQYTARCSYSNGTSSDCTAMVTWSSSSPAVATVSGGGLASGVGAGTTTIKAASGSVSGTATLTVTSAVLTAIAVTPTAASIAAGSGSQQYTARCSYSNGSSSDCTAMVTWSSSNPAVATISGGGLASGVGAGTTTIKAVSGSVSGTATLTVTGTVLTAIAVTPATASIATGSGSQQYTARCTYSNSSTSDCTATVTWSSSNPAVATISGGGLASGVAAGTTTIKAASGNISGIATLTVTDTPSVDLTSGIWAWMSGSKTTPGAPNGLPGTYPTLGTSSAESSPGSRESSVSWTDRDGNLWLFGGEGFDSAGIAGDLNDLWQFLPSTEEWAWMGGEKSLPRANEGWPGVYGTRGASSPKNSPGGRKGASGWTDRAGNLWLFGGYGFDSEGTQGSLNDLWEYDPLAMTWVWKNGTSTVPAAGKGQPGVYGDLGIADSANTPGARSGANSWTDLNGNLWLFGGVGYDSTGSAGSLNDLWMMDPSAAKWTWMSGSRTVGPSGGQTGVYGSLATPAANNAPSGRSQAVSWIDRSGDLWLFGGKGFDAAGTRGYLNDLWEFNPSTRQWAWMGGGSILRCNECGHPGIYGTPGEAGAANIPGGREQAVGWTDGEGNLWLLGGNGFDSNATQATLNDLWELLPATHQWAWMGGSNTAAGTNSGRPGVYGTLRVPSAGNVPGARAGASGWVDVDGNLWLFGGLGYDSGRTNGDLNDLWVYQPSVDNLAAAVPTLSLASGTYDTAQTVTIVDATPGATIHYTTDGTTPTIHSSVYVSPITVSATKTIKAIAIASGYKASAIVSAHYTITKDDSFSIALRAGSASNVTVQPGGAATYSLVVTPVGTAKFPAAITLSATGIPSGSTATFTPQKIAAGAGVTDVTLLVQTRSAIAAKVSAGPKWPLTLSLIFLPLVGIRRLRLYATRWSAASRMLAAILFLAGMAMALSGCGSVVLEHPTPGPATPYTITITGTSGQVLETTTVTITVD